MHLSTLLSPPPLLPKRDPFPPPPLDNDPDGGVVEGFTMLRGNRLATVRVHVDESTIGRPLQFETRACALRAVHRAGRLYVMSIESCQTGEQFETGTTDVGGSAEYECARLVHYEVSQYAHSFAYSLNRSSVEGDGLRFVRCKLAALHMRMDSYYYSPPVLPLPPPALYDNYAFSFGLDGELISATDGRLSALFAPSAADDDDCTPTLLMCDGAYYVQCDTTKQWYLYDPQRQSIDLSCIQLADADAKVQAIKQAVAYANTTTFPLSVMAHDAVSRQCP